MPSIFFIKPDPEDVRRHTAGWSQVWVWLPAVLAVGMIAIESTETFSAANTSRWLRPIYESWFGRVTDSTWFWYHHAARKLGHFVGFAVVCLAFLRAWLLSLGRRTDLGYGSWLLRANAYAVLCTTAVASLDEWHQRSLAGRTGKFSDVLIDTAGGLVLCGSALALRSLAALWAGEDRRSMVASVE